MTKLPAWPFLLILLLSACSAFPGKAPVALALENLAQPFQVGVEIAKPTYTPLPTATLPPSSVETIQTPLPINTPSSATFAEDAFVVVENLPASGGYDSTTQYDSPPSYSGTKHILVDISEQHMYVYDGDELVYSFIASTGMDNSTRVGTFSVLNKIPNAYGATWNIWMPNWLGIYWSGSLQNGIHALPILPNACDYGSIRSTYCQSSGPNGAPEARNSFTFGARHVDPVCKDLFVL